MAKMTFEQWQAKVNQAIINQVDLEIDDLPDYDYWNAWNDGETPAYTAKMVIANAYNAF
jgi:hypothetical protein